MNEKSLDINDIYSAVNSDGEHYINIPVNNMQEYNDLIELAMRQASELNRTISLLKTFEVKMKIIF